MAGLMDLGVETNPYVYAIMKEIIEFDVNMAKQGNVYTGLSRYYPREKPINGMAIHEVSVIVNGYVDNNILRARWFEIINRCHVYPEIYDFGDVVIVETVDKVFPPHSEYYDYLGKVERYPLEFTTDRLKMFEARYDDEYEGCEDSDDDSLL